KVCSRVGFKPRGFHLGVSSTSKRSPLMLITFSSWDREAERRNAVLPHPSIWQRSHRWRPKGPSVKTLLVTKYSGRPWRRVFTPFHHCLISGCGMSEDSLNVRDEVRPYSTATERRVRRFQFSQSHIKLIQIHRGEDILSIADAVSHF